MALTNIHAERTQTGWEKEIRREREKGKRVQKKSILLGT
jgi:hypothetical protein